MRLAPWPDFAGNELHEGDTIRHPSGEQGTVIYMAELKDPDSRWRVRYRDGTTSRLALQIGDKGQACRVDPKAVSVAGRVDPLEREMLIWATIHAYDNGEMSEGQCVKALGVDRLAWRELLEERTLPDPSKEQK